jgi:D-alanine-D-alanine ligase
MKKIKLALIFGGKSAEHEISLISAKSIYQALDKNKYDIELIGIDKSGKWYLSEKDNWLINAHDPKLIELNASDDEVLLVPESGTAELLHLNHKDEKRNSIDVAFPVLHGTYGEDGTIQGLLRALNIPFVGPDILGSAVGMDKDVAKRLLRDAGIAIADFVCLSKKNINDWPYDSLVKKLGSPLFIKPANAGSSVGVHKVGSVDEYDAAIKDAFQFDLKILVEEAIIGREIECAVLGNENPQASEIGEIIPTKDFYSYEAKYIDAEGALLRIPAVVNHEEKMRIQETAIKVFEVLCCEGMARVDFFLKSDGGLILNEINTIPGFTSISMYPKLWEASGLAYSDLIDRLIELAISRHLRNNSLKTSY